MSDAKRRRNSNYIYLSEVQRHHPFTDLNSLFTQLFMSIFIRLRAPMMLYA